MDKYNKKSYKIIISNQKENIFTISIDSHFLEKVFFLNKKKKYT